VCLTSTAVCLSSVEYIGPRTQKPRKTKIRGIQRWCASDICLLHTLSISRQQNHICLGKLKLISLA